MTVLASLVVLVQLYSLQVMEMTVENGQKLMVLQTGKMLSEDGYNNLV
jgi:hypothetical protein